MNFINEKFLPLFHRSREWIDDKLLKRHARSALTYTVSEISARLSEFSNALESVCRQTEPHFLQLGEDLQNIYSDAEDLTKRALETIQRISGESENGIIGRIGELAQKSVDELNKRQAHVERNLEKVNAIVEHLDSLDALCGVIERIAMFLKIIGLNIDIESSRSLEGTEMFSVVAQEMRTLSQKVIGIARTMRQDAKEAQTAQMSAHNEIIHGLVQLKKLAYQAEKAVQDAVGEIQHFISRSMTVLNQVSEYSEAVSMQIDQIVVGIQFHDSMNQRVEHIIKAIHDVQSMLGSIKAPESGDSLAEIAGGASAVIHLQAEQLKQIITDADTVYQKNQDAFSRIGDEADKIAQTLGMLNELQEVSGDHAAPLHNTFINLKSALENLRELMGQGRNLVEQIQKTTALTSETTDRLSSLMEQIKVFGFETRLIALNAIIKASHIGEMGSTLEVLSQEMGKVSQRTSEFVSSVQRILDTIGLSASGLQVVPDSDETLPVGTARAKLDVGIQDISNSYNGFRADAAKVFYRAESMHSAISTIRSALDFLPKLSAELTGMLNQLEAIRQEISVWVTQNVGISMAEFDKMAERYTMQKEREIHEQIIKSNSNGEASEEVREAVTEDVEKTGDEMGENVELF